MTGRLIYNLNVSLDGFVEDRDHGLDWATVDDELHGWFNEQTRSLDAEIYGRKLYETMAAYWPRGEDDPDATPIMREFARLWNAMPRVVFSTTLTSALPNHRIVQGDVAAVLEELRRDFDGDIGVGGANIAGQYVTRGLVDEFRLMVHPVVLGSGTPYWPALDRPLNLKLVDRHEFSSGVELRSYVPAER